MMVARNKVIVVTMVKSWSHSEYILKSNLTGFNYVLTVGWL